MSRRVALFALVLALITGQARGATFTVNSTADATDGTCGPALGGCTLREAIEAVVATAGRDTIRFDSSVFPIETGEVIVVASPLPVILDAAGTVVDGAGARVIITGGAAPSDGLVFASPAGVALEKVTVANLTFGGFAGTAIVLCGGTPPFCFDDVEGALVRNVAVASSGEKGIDILGGVIRKAQVIDSVVAGAGSSGIRIFGLSLVKPRVRGSSALRNDNSGIELSASGSLVGATIEDAVAVRNGGHGISVQGPGGISKTKIAHVLATRNTAFGIAVGSNQENAGAKVSDAVANGNGFGGISLAGAPVAGATLDGVVADGNASEGIGFVGHTVGAKITRTTAVSNSGHGIEAASGFVTSVGFDGAKISGVVAANNDDGFFLRAGTSTLTKIRAGANLGTGITIFEGNHGNTIAKNTTGGNGRNGITLIKSLDNVVEKNVAIGSGSADLRDDTDECGTNVWESNVFVTRSDPCIQ